MTAPAERSVDAPVTASGRGRLRVYLGAAPGVGKTYAMLGEAHRRLSRGTHVVVGFVETHDRVQTEAMVAGLEVIPRRQIEYRGAIFGELDVQAVIDRRPAVALVDELAHTNVPGSGHTKRWQDINDLLAAGIDVVSTVNIQHLESLNDVVEAITGVKQRETVPDAVVRAADQLELVDMSPEALRRRLAHGNVYAPEKVDAALANYFRVGNLTALRELALLWMADRVEEGLERYREAHGIRDTWAARSRIVVALDGGPQSEFLLRRGALIAGRSAGRDLVGVHVARSDGTAGAAPESLARLRQLAEDLGGGLQVVSGDDPARAVLDFARSMNGTQIVVGLSPRSRWSRILRSSTADEIVRDSGEIDVHVVTHAVGSAHGQTLRPLRHPRQRQAVAWVLAVAIPIGLTLLLRPLREHLNLSSLLLAFLLGVVASSLVGGLLPAVATAVEASLLANYYFVPPVGTFTIAAPENVFALAVFVVVAAVVASIVDRSRSRAAEAARQGAEANILAAMSTGVLRRGDGVKALLDQVRETFALDGAALLEVAGKGERASVVEVSGLHPPLSLDAADVRVDAGQGVVLALCGPPLAASDRRILDAFAAQAAAVLERNRLAARAADAARLKESVVVRNSLLAAVSHDLRTPLAGIKATINTLQEPQLDLDEADRAELLTAAGESVERLDSLVANLLDLSRIQSGVVQPRLESVSLDEVLQRALHGVDPARVSDETEDDLPLILTDVGLLERVLANLIENAVRHSPPDHKVRLSAVALPEGVLQLQVIDRGPGVSESGKRLMFEPFQRLGDVPDGAGVGLGLAVARGLVEAVGADLQAEDTPGGGLTMVVAVPLAGQVEGVATGEAR